MHAILFPRINIYKIWLYMTKYMCCASDELCSHLWNSCSPLLKYFQAVIYLYISEFTISFFLYWYRSYSPEKSYSWIRNTSLFFVWFIVFFIDCCGVLHWNIADLRVNPENTNTIARGAIHIAHGTSQPTQWNNITNEWGYTHETDVWICIK